MVIYSEDAEMDGNVSLLIDVALRMFAAREDDSDPEMRRFGEILNADHVSKLRIPLPRSLVGETACFLTTTMVPRDRLPGGHLAAKLLPVLVAPPSDTTAIAVLPLERWDPALPATIWEEDKAMEETFDYKTSMMRMRDARRGRDKGMGFLARRRYRAKAPPWAKGDPALAAQYRDMKPLLTQGRLSWGWVAAADPALQEPDAPPGRAVIVHSDDPRITENPGPLAEIGQRGWRRRSSGRARAPGPRERG